MEWNMGNGNKIKINKPEVKLFLHDDLLPSEAEKPELYNLEQEYAKTKSKKISFVLLVLLSCIAAVTLLTYGLARYLQIRNDSMKVDITVFEDLNLRNLLNVVSQTQNALEQTATQKNQLEIEFSTRKAQAALDREAQLQLLESLKKDNSEKEREISIIQREYAETIALLNLEYEPQLALYESQMEDFTKQLSSYDSANVELAQQQEAAINSQRQIYELEKQSLIADYDQIIQNLTEELETTQANLLSTQRNTMETLNKQHSQEISTLDPVFLDTHASSVINTLRQNMPDNSPLPIFSIDSFMLELSDPSIQKQAEESLVRISNDFSDYNYLSDIVSQVPWQNSLNDYVHAINTKANEIGIETVQASIELLKQQDETIVKKTTAINEQEERIIDLENQLSIANKVLEEKDAELNNVNATLLEKNKTLENNILIVEQLKQKNAEQIVFVEDMQAQIHPLLEIKESHEKLIASFDERARENGDTGYILYISDTNRIGVYISPLYQDSIKDGMRAYVFREPGSVIGEITLHLDGSAIYARANQEITEKLRINDVILLELIQ